MCLYLQLLLLLLKSQCTLQMKSFLFPLSKFFFYFFRVHQIVHYFDANQKWYKLLPISLCCTLLFTCPAFLCGCSGCSYSLLALLLPVLLLLWSNAIGFLSLLLVWMYKLFSKPHIVYPYHTHCLFILLSYAALLSYLLLKRNLVLLSLLKTPLRLFSCIVKIVNYSPDFDSERIVKNPFQLSIICLFWQ